MVKIKTKILLIAVLLVVALLIKTAFSIGNRNIIGKEVHNFRLELFLLHQVFEDGTEQLKIRIADARRLDARPLHREQKTL